MGVGFCPPLSFLKTSAMYGILAFSTAETYATSITDAEVKAWLKVDHSDEDSLISALRDAACEQVEAHTGRKFRNGLFTVVASDFRHLQRLPLGNLTGTPSITYKLENDATSYTLASTEYTTAEIAGVWYTRFRNSLPTVDPYNPQAVVLSCQGGVTATSMPEDVRTAAMMLVGHWFENRSAVHIGSSIQELPLAVNALLAKYRVQ